MDIKDQTRELNEAFDETKDKARDLNECLKVLSGDGIDKLSRAVTQAVAAGKSGGSRQPAGDIVQAELSKILMDQVKSIFTDLFEKPAPKNKRGPEDLIERDGKLQVIIYNNASSVVSARQTMDVFNQKQLEITIDQMVASSLVRGQQTTGVLNSIFGLAPGLIGR